MPIRIQLDPTKANNYKAWLLLLSLCHHIPEFKEKFISTTFLPQVVGRRTDDAQEPQPAPGTKQWFVNRIHFPRALLEHRSTYKISQNLSLLPPAVAKRIAKIDGKGRLIETVNKVSALERFAKRILPATAFKQFQQSQKQKGCQHYYVQAPVGTLDEAKLYVSSLLRFGKLALNRKPLVAPTKRASTKKRPPAAQVTPSAKKAKLVAPTKMASTKKRPPAAEVTPSAKKAKLQQRQENSVDFITSIVGTHSQTSSPLRHKEQPISVAPSPLKNIATSDQCRANILAASSTKSQNFALSMRALRVMYDNFDPIRVGTKWFYPCGSTKCTSKNIGFLALSKKLRKDHQQLCPDCLLAHQKNRKKTSHREKRSTLLSRMPPITAMSDDEKTDAYKGLQVKVKRCTQSNKRLCQRLMRKSPKITINNVSDAVDMVKKAYQYIASSKLEASKMIIDAVIDMETSNRIPIEQQEDRQRYASFIVSDIVNACKSFTGAKNKIRFHPIMANLAMNLYMGMKYDDIVDASPFIFPSVRTIQRNRAKVATHEGTDPKVYARVSEMSGFKTDADMHVHWMFDEVKLTSGVMWNATNDDFRGLCCGTKGSVEDLKDTLEELLCEGEKITVEDDCGEGGRDGIYCNQWLARNPFGTTLMGEFFYNEGNLDGNEIMRQFLQVSTSAALANLKTVGVVSDMGGCNERFYHYLRDGNTIELEN